MSPSAEYFRWRHYHPHAAEDPSAVWAAAWNAGGRSAMHDSSRLVELVPLLTDLLQLLQDERVEAEVRGSDRRGPYAPDADECLGIAKQPVGVLRFESDICESDCEVSW